MVRRRSTARHGSSVLPVFFLLLILLAVGFFVVLFPSINASRFGKYDRYNVLINQNPPVVVSVDIKAKSAVVISFPSEMILNTAHGYGQLPAGSIYQAGEWDKRGRLVLGDTISDTLGVPIDLVTDAVSTNISKDNFSSKGTFWQPIFWKLPKFSPTALLTSPKNEPYQPNIYDWGKFASLWSGLRSDRIQFVNLSNNLVDYVQSNGGQIKTMDLEAFDQQNQGTLIYKSILEESYRVAVINSTGVNGLASRASRLLTNVGINVVYMDNQTNGLSGCEVSYSLDAIKASKTLNMIVEYFGCKTAQNHELDSRFDLLIVLGNQFAQRFEK